MSFRNYHNCAECGEKLSVYYSRYCVKHAMKMARYGTVKGRRLLASELEPYRDIVGRALAARYNFPAVKAALDETSDLLNYRPSHGWTVQLQIQSQMQRLRDGGVTADELLRAVCPVYTMELLDASRFSGAREVDFHAARQVLKLRSLHQWRPSSRFLSHLGTLLRETLTGFAYALTREAMKVDAVKEQRRNEMLTGWK